MTDRIDLAAIRARVAAATPGPWKQWTGRLSIFANAHGDRGVVDPLSGGDAVSAQVILVTGSRALADSPEATRWAREILARELASATLVVAGDARGPDTWAHEIAAGFVAPIPCERWSVSGVVDFYDGRGPLDWVHVGGWNDASTPTDPRRRPLARNAAMLVAYEPFHATVRLVALRHAASPTQGTAHTVGLARAAGIDVTEYTWGAP